MSTQETGSGPRPRPSAGADPSPGAGPSAGVGPGAGADSGAHAGASAGAGAPVRIRAARPYDAAALLDLKRGLDQETSFMMFEPGERDSSAQDLGRELASLARSDNSVVLLAELGDQLAGYLELTGGSFRRSRTTAYLVIGVRAHAASRGIGTALLRSAKEWAAAHNLHRLELTVMAHNTRAIRLYERMGFTVEGRRTECLYIDGHFIDELTMAVLLPTPLTRPIGNS